MRVRSSNSYGFGEYQTVLEVVETLRTTPYQMLPVTRNADTNYNRIVIDWIALDPITGEDGNSDILGYSV